jgi:hypothetical protein
MLAGPTTFTRARSVAAAGALLLCAACNQTQPPFELSPSNRQIADALTQMLATAPGCKPFSVTSARVWQYPEVRHYNQTSYQLEVDADVTATRLAPPAAGDVQACFGQFTASPDSWPVGQAQTLRVLGSLGFAGQSWALDAGATNAAQDPHLPLAAAPHAFRQGMNDSPGR